MARALRASMRRRRREIWVSGSCWRRNFARIHRQNLVNYGILPLTFVDEADYDRLHKGDVLRVDDLRRALKSGEDVTFDCRGPVRTRHGLTALQIDVILAGGLINWRRNESQAAA